MTAAMNAALRALLDAHLPAGMSSEVLLSPRSRRLRMQMRDQALQLRLPPRVTLSEIERFLAQSAHWIRGQHARALALQQQLEAELSLKLPQGYLPLWGDRREWQCQAGPARVDLWSAPISIGLDPAHPQASERLRRLLRTALARALHQRGSACIERLRECLPCPPGRLRIRPMRSLWGSLSPRGDMSLNLGLVFLPPELADYVVAHELAHLRQRNHSAAFWREVQSLDPDWRQAREQLRTQHDRVQLLLSALT